MIRNIIFDFGGVLIDFNGAYFIEAFGGKEEDKKLLLNEVFLSKEWAMIDRGLIDETGAFERIKKNLPERLHEIAYNLIFNWDQVVKPIDGMAEYITDLKKRCYKVYLLSNASARLTDYWKRIQGNELFDDKVVSGCIQMIKPQDEIYKYLLDHLKLNPKECVFIDDLPNNICGAEQNGIKGIVFHNDVEELKEKLERLLKEEQNSESCYNMCSRR